MLTKYFPKVRPWLNAWKEKSMHSKEMINIFFMLHVLEPGNQNSLLSLKNCIVKVEADKREDNH